MNTLFPDACRKCSYKSALKAAMKKINVMHPAIRSPSFQSATDTTKCPEVIRMTASQLTWSFGAGRIFAARNKCPTASIQCATTTNRASTRGFVINQTVSLWELRNNCASLAQKGKGRRDFSPRPLLNAGSVLAQPYLTSRKYPQASRYFSYFDRRFRLPGNNFKDRIRRSARTGNTYHTFSGTTNATSTSI